MSVKLTDAQLAMMSAAAQREDRCLTAPATMRDAAISKVSAKLAKLGLLREIRAKAGMPAWRRDKAGQGYALKLTAAGLKAVVVVEGSEGAIESIDMTKTCALPEDVGEHAKTRAPRDSSKLGRVIRLLRRSDGATIVDLTGATGWLPHTARAALTGLRKRGYGVVRERVAAGGSIYRISGAAADGGNRIVVQPNATDGDDKRAPKTSQAA
jgi:hypothetical protein